MDGTCLRFLGVNYEDLVAKIKEGATDEEIWECSLQHGEKHSDEEILIWNAYMMKYGWRDNASEILQRRLKEGGYEDRPDIQTIFDFLDLDEGRESRCAAVEVTS
jgi:gluconokinase